jgi:hypothetical protein
VLWFLLWVCWGCWWEMKWMRSDTTRLQPNPSVAVVRILEHSLQDGRWDFVCLYVCQETQQEIPLIKVL